MPNKQTLSMLRELREKATGGEWRSGVKGPNGCPIIGNGHGLMVAMLAHSINHQDQAEEANANEALIIALHNHADELLAKAEAHDKLVELVNDAITAAALAGDENFTRLMQEELTQILTPEGNDDE